jgi:hypothetical protein
MWFSCASVSAFYSLWTLRILSLHHYRTFSVLRCYDACNNWLVFFFFFNFGPGGIAPCWTEVVLIPLSWYSSCLCGRLSNPMPPQHESNYRLSQSVRPSIPSHIGTQPRHRISNNIFKKSWERCAARNTAGALARLLSLDAKFVNNFKKNTRVFNTHYNIAQYISNGITISRYREGYLRPIMGDTQLFLWSQILSHKEHWIGYK